MSKIRTVKPELFRHELLFDAEQKTQLPLRLAFISLFTCCDREGRFRWNPRLLKLDMFPYDEINVSEVLEALAHYGFVIKYHVKNEVYGVIPSWDKHQRINLRESASILPHVTEGVLITPPYSSHEEESTPTPPAHRSESTVMPGTCTHVRCETASFTDAQERKISANEQNFD